MFDIYSRDCLDWDLSLSQYFTIADPLCSLLATVLL